MVFRALFTAFTLVLLLITQPTLATDNEDVFAVCKHYFEDSENPKTILCDVYMGAINDWRIFNMALVNYLKDEGYKSKAETISEHDIFGCNTEEISRTEFLTLYLDYMKENEDLMEDSFVMTIGDALEPYCDKNDRKKEPSFYLEEDEHMKKS